jgi:hypothetical protein
VTVVAVGAVVIAAGTVGAAFLIGTRDDGDAVSAPTARLSYEQLAQRPARGNLAQDAAFLKELDQAWDNDETNQVLNLIGEDSEVLTPPHIVWAGTSPAGPAAMVVAKVRLKNAWDGTVNPPDGEAWIAGFLGEDETELGTVAVKDADIVTDVESSAWFVEANGAPRTIAVVDTGGRYVWNTGFARTPDGRLSSENRPVTFTDGVAFVAVPGSADPDEIQVLRDGQMVLGGTDNPVGDSFRSMIWGGKAHGPVRIGGLGTTDSAAAARRAAVLRSQVLSRLPAGLTTGEPVWLAAGKLPDGTVAVVYLDTFGRAPAHTFLALVTSDGGEVRHLGPVTARRAPVFADLPDGSGRIVVQFGARLRYETATGELSPPAKDALFVPGEAASVTIQGSDGATYPLGD